MTRSVKYSLLLLFILSAFALDAKDYPLPERVNLALRRSADQLLRIEGDLSSRIPAVEQLNDSTWRVKIEQEIAYDSLPYVLQSSFLNHGIAGNYTVTLKKCEDETIDLGFQAIDIIQGTVACQGRAFPEGCHFIEVVFINESVSVLAKSNFLSNDSILLLSLGLVLGFVFFVYNKTNNTKVPQNLESIVRPMLDFGKSSLDVRGLTLYVNGDKKDLTFREARLLQLFVDHRNELLDREYIQKEVWEDGGVMVSRSVDVFVSRLRKKLAEDDLISIVGIHGVGYRLEVG